MTSKLQAPVVLPSRDDLRITLVRSDQLDRLEEYRSDENLFFGLAGLFAGAILGILDNWFTNEEFVITKPTLVLMVLLAILAIGCGLRAWALKKRARRVKDRLLRIEELVSEVGCRGAGGEIVEQLRPFWVTLPISGRLRAQSGASSLSCRLQPRF